MHIRGYNKPVVAVVLKAEGDSLLDHVVQVAPHRPSSFIGIEQKQPLLGSANRSSTIMSISGLVSTAGALSLCYLTSQQQRTGKDIDRRQIRPSFDRLGEATLSDTHLVAATKYTHLSSASEVILASPPSWHPTTKTVSNSRPFERWIVMSLTLREEEGEGRHELDAG